MAFLNLVLVGHAVHAPASAKRSSIVVEHVHRHMAILLQYLVPLAHAECQPPDRGDLFHREVCSGNISPIPRPVAIIRSTTAVIAS